MKNVFEGMGNTLPPLPPDVVVIQQSSCPSAEHHPVCFSLEELRMSKRSGAASLSNGATMLLERVVEPL